MKRFILIYHYDVSINDTRDRKMTESEVFDYLYETLYYFDIKEYK